VEVGALTLQEGDVASSEGVFVGAGRGLSRRVGHGEMIARPFVFRAVIHREEERVKLFALLALSSSLA
jgi:hypothetical protein